MQMLYWYSTKRLPNRYNKKEFSPVSLAGTSFLINFYDLYKDNSDILYKVQYIKLAARRDYTHYKQYKSLVLQTSYFPDILYSAIKSNPLLTITPTTIEFKYEK